MASIPARPPRGFGGLNTQRLQARTSRRPLIDEDEYAPKRAEILASCDTDPAPGGQPVRADRGYRHTPRYHRPMEAGRDILTVAWVQTEGRLPPGWTLDSLRCASTGLQAEERSEDWIAVAVAPDGTERRFRAPDAITALTGLVDSFERG